jgi:hypothetical protein
VIRLSCSSNAECPCQMIFKVTLSVYGTFFFN